MAEKVQRRAAFLLNTFDPTIIPHQVWECWDIVPVLFQDNRRLLQQWSDELAIIYITQALIAWKIHNAEVTGVASWTKQEF